MSAYIIFFKNGQVALAEDERTIEDLRLEIATKEQLQIVGSFALENDDLGQTGTFLIDTIGIDHLEKIEEGGSIGTAFEGRA